MRKAKIGIIGSGRMAKNHLERFLSIETVDDDINGVVICTHNDSHGEIAIAALKADKHVFVEYPLATNVNEGELALHLAKTRKRVLRVLPPEVVSNTHAALKQKISELGKLLLTSFVRLTPGRGAWPETLFNLPAHFFIYHIYSIVDFFGEAAGWKVPQITKV